MSDQLRDRLHEEMARAHRPPVDQLVARSMAGATRTRQVRRTAAGLGTAAVVGITVLAVTIGSQLGAGSSSSSTGLAGDGGASPVAAVTTTVAPATPPSSAAAATAAPAAASNDADGSVAAKLAAAHRWEAAKQAATAASPPTWTSPPPGTPVTTGGILQLLTTQLAPLGTIDSYAVAPEDETHVQIHLTSAAGTDVMQVSMYQDTAGEKADCLPPPAPSMDAVTACYTDSQGDYVVVWKDSSGCVRSQTVVVVHPDGSAVSFDLATCLSEGGTVTQTAGVITAAKAAELGADPRWDLSMQPALVSAGATNFPQPAAARLSAVRLRRADRHDDSGRRGGGGDPDFTAYATQAVSRLRDTAFLMCRDWHLADDLTQATLTKLYLAWSRVSQAEDVDAYARKVLLRTYLDHRRRRWTSEVSTAAVPEVSGNESPDLRLTLVDALGLLRPQDRAVLVLRYWEDYSVEQVASLLEIREGAVRTRTMRALAKLREVLGQDLAELLG